MPALKMVWTGRSHSQFQELKKRAQDCGRLDEFAALHTEIVSALSDLEQALEKGEPLYHTLKPGGEVRKWIHGFIAVTYAVFAAERVGWILRYQSVPESWPD